MIAFDKPHPDQENSIALSSLADQCLRILEHGWRGLVEISRDGKVMRANQAFAGMLGYDSPRDMTALPPFWFQNICRVSEHCIALLGELTSRGAVSQFELQVRHSSGSLRTLILDAVASVSPGRKLTSFVVVVEDVTDKKAAKLRQAFHDPLTGLSNRTVFTDRLDQALERTKRKQGDLFALAFLDLDNFKDINDRFGNITGDYFLTTIGKRLQNSLRNVDAVARYGGDEFVVLLDGVENGSEALHTLDRVRRELSSPVQIADGQEISCPVSIGLVLSTGYTTARQMLHDADQAMYRSKSLHHERVYLMHNPAAAKPSKTHIFPDEVLRGLERGQFRLHYQPIFQLGSRDISGFEALLRWQHPRIGLLSPEVFLPLVEKVKRVHFLASWVLGTACAQMRLWQRQYICDPSLTISVHLSDSQFTFPKLADNIKAVLEATDLAENSLKLEFSREAMNRVKDIGDHLMRLKELNVQLSIDDMGMGYSHLLQLKRFPFVPVDNLKLNRSIIGRMMEHNDSMEMVWTTIMLAHSLGIEVTGEGVETREQLNALVDMNCDYAQGNLFSSPLESALAGELLSCCLLPKGSDGLHPAGKSDSAFEAMRKTARSTANGFVSSG